MTLVEDDFGSQIVWCPCQKLQNSIGDVPTGRASQEDSAPKLCCVWQHLSYNEIFLKYMHYLGDCCLPHSVKVLRSISLAKPKSVIRMSPLSSSSKFSPCITTHKRQSSSSQDSKKNLKPTMVNPLEQVTSTCCTHVRQLTKFYCNGLQLEMKTLRSR